MSKNGSRLSQHDSIETPSDKAGVIHSYIDEIAAFLRKNLTEELGEGEKPQHARAFNILTTAMEQICSSGFFVTAGVQTSKATNVPTDVRDNFGARLIFAAADDNAGRTAGESSAANLPMSGGFIFKTGRSTVIGRGAYLKAQTEQQELTWPVTTLASRTW